VSPCMHASIRVRQHGRENGDKNTDDYNDDDGYWSI